MKAFIASLKIRELGIEEGIPYELLLLADETRDAIDEYINTSDIFVIEKGDAIVAVYVLYAQNNTQVEIKNIAVIDKLQGMGIGHLLLEDASKRAIRAGYREIIVGTPDVSNALIHFYEDAGFVVYGKREDFYIKNYPEPIIENGVRLVDMVLLKKDLEKQ